MQRNSFLVTMTAIVAVVVLSAACSGADTAPRGTASPSATASPVPFVTAPTVPSPTAPPVASFSARPTAAVDWPTGVEVPEALRGIWYEPSYPTKMTLDGNGYTFVQPAAGAHGNVVVNGDEIDFFNGNQCGMSLPRGIGKYRWELVGESAVKFTALNEDPCGRVDILAGATWTRMPATPTSTP